MKAQFKYPVTKLSNRRRWASTGVCGLARGRGKMTSAFSPREFLRSRHAALVHFSTVMARRLDLMFPNDMRRAMTLKGVPLAFSTIQLGDTNPHMAGPGGAEGSVGMLVDLGTSTLIKSVSPSDSGSNATGSLGRPPTEANCTESIDQRATSNEWHVQDYVPVPQLHLAAHPRSPGLRFGRHADTVRSSNVA